MDDPCIAALFRVMQFFFEQRQCIFNRRSHASPTEAFVPRERNARDKFKLFDNRDNKCIA